MTLLLTPLVSAKIVILESLSQTKSPSVPSTYRCASLVAYFCISTQSQSVCRRSWVLKWYISIDNSSKQHEKYRFWSYMSTSWEASFEASSLLRMRHLVAAMRFLSNLTATGPMQQKSTPHLGSPESPTCPMFESKRQTSGVTNDRAFHCLDPQREGLPLVDGTTLCSWIRPSP